MTDERAPVDRTAGRLKVLDLGTMVAGPIVATLLGDLGAEVIKVEQPGRGDPTREGGMSPRWHVEGRNKRSVTLNLRVAAGQDLLRRLVPWADILVENFRPGTMAGWGLGYEDLSVVNPRLVYVSVSGYGQDGPYHRRAGYDFTGGAFGGITYVTGYSDRPPVLPGHPVIDYGTGAFATVGALEALRQRDCEGGTGRGRWIDCALYETVLRMSGHDFVNYGRTGLVREREGGMPLAAGRSNAPHTFTYRTRDGHWVSTYVALDSHFARLSELIGDPELDRSEMATKTGRFAHASELYEAMRAWIETIDLAELTRLMDEAGLPFSPVNSVADIVEDPHVQARQNVFPVQTVDGDEILMQDAFPRFDRGATNVRWTGEHLGASNADVYGGLLGIDDGELEQLAVAGII